MNHLPVDILEYNIFDYLDSQDIIHLSLLNKGFHKRLDQIQILSVLQSQSVWPFLDLSHIESLDHLPLKKLSSISLKFKRIEIDSLLFVQVYQYLPLAHELILNLTISDVNLLISALNAVHVTSIKISCRTRITQHEMNLILNNIDKMPALKSIYFGCHRYQCPESFFVKLSNSKIQNLFLNKLDRSTLKLICPSTTIAKLGIATNGCLHKCENSSPSHDIISGIAYNPFAFKKLTELSGEIPKELLNRMLEVLPELNLQTLNLDFQLQHDSLELLCQTLSKSHLSTLSLVADDNLPTMMKSISKSRVQNLSLSRLEPEYIQSAKKVFSVKLESLKLAGKFSEDSLDLLFSHLNVQELEIDGWIPKEALEIIESHLKKTKIRKVSLKLKSFGEGGFQYLIPMVRDIPIQTLEIYWNGNSLSRISQFIFALGNQIRHLKIQCWKGFNAKFARLLACKYPKLMLEVNETE
ncbi:hypothetical protein HDV01_002369 [Terramyces sp. JEL0728]|nr:hypothetical protein HDV01_002369 [Terramyces sp. JEL0728]